ncbi:MAG: hypothetical protein SOW93_08535 [Limosilactobacillus reuteri]|nr:hypothetical protein [Limosilactobacillus reuteri]
MEILVTLFDLVFLVAFIVAIVYGIRWFKGRKDKENESLKKNKKYFWILNFKNKLATGLK